MNHPEGERPTISDNRLVRIVELALLEDIGMGDLTSDAVLGEEDQGVAEMVSKSDGVIAGLELAGLVFHLCDETVVFQALIVDGSDVSRREVIAKVHGPVRSLLRAERTALNFLQRASGIATMTRRFVREVEGTRACITDTRKTAPGLRLVDKLAVRLGGGVNHRFALDDMVLIKDNHVVAAGGITEAVERCRHYLSSIRLPASIEVETRTLDEVREVLGCQGVRRVMLDNFRPEEAHEAVLLVDGRLEVEASGGITLENVRRYAEAGVDFISIGALTHSVHALDISMEILPLQT